MNGKISQLNGLQLCMYIVLVLFLLLCSSTCFIALQCRGISFSHVQIHCSDSNMGSVHIFKLYSCECVINILHIGNYFSLNTFYSIL